MAAAVRAAHMRTRLVTMHEIIAESARTVKRLAAWNAVGLDGARELLQARLHLTVDLLGRQRERDAAFQFLERFDVDGHGDLPGFERVSWCAGPDSDSSR